MKNVAPKSWWWLALSALLAAGMWIYVLQIWGAGQFSRFSDLYAPWWAAHELVRGHRDPYTAAVAHEIQTFIYGAPSVARFPGDPQEIAGGFAYPIYATFFLLPAIGFDFAAVQTAMAWIFAGLVMASVLFWLYLLRWQLSPFRLLTIMLCVLGSFPVVQAIQLRNLTVVAVFLIAAGLAALSRERLVLAGVLLGAATMKPQFVILLIPWLGIWTLGDWKRRRALASGFMASTLVLLALGEWLLPGWVGKFLRILTAYRQYTYSHSLLDLWFPFPLNWGLAGLLIATAANWGYRFRKAESGSREFALGCSWILAVTLIAVPTFSPHAQMLLLPGYLLLTRHRQAIWNLGRWPRLLLVLACSLPLWESLAAAAMTAAMLPVPVAVLRNSWLVVLYPSPLLPLGIVLALGYLLARGVPAGIEHV